MMWTALLMAMALSGIVPEALSESKKEPRRQMHALVWRGHRFPPPPWLYIPPCRDAVAEEAIVKHVAETYPADVERLRAAEEKRKRKAQRRLELVKE